MTVTGTIRRTFLFVTLAAILLLGGCAAPAPVEPTMVQAPTEAPPPTPPPTATPMPTLVPPYYIDMDKFHTVPASYDYLLAHPDEFVRSPDPINERATFDWWFDEGLVPALGPIEERPINMLGSSVGGSRYSFMALGMMSELGTTDITPVTGPLSFFYFETDGVVYPTVCITAAAEGFEERSKHTLCTAMFDSPSVSYGTDALEALATGRSIYYFEILFDAAANRPDLEWGIMEELTRSLGDYSNDENRNKFGFGTFVFIGLEYHKSLYTPTPIEREHSELIPLLRSQVNDLTVPAAENGDDAITEWLTTWASTLTGPGVDERIRLESASLTDLTGYQLSSNAPYVVAILDIVPETVEGSPWLADGYLYLDERGHYGIPLAFEFKFNGQYLWASSLSTGLLATFMVENETADCPADEAFAEEMFSQWMERFMLEEAHSFDQISGYEVTAVTPFDEAGTYRVDFSVMPVGMDDSRWAADYPGTLNWTTHWLTGSTANLMVICLDEGIRIAIYNPDA